LPESIRKYITPPPKVTVQDAPEDPNPLSFGERIAGTRLGRTLSKEAREGLAKLQLEIDTITLINPELRLRLPQPDPRFALHPESYRHSFKICCEYYWKYQHVRFDKEAANQVAALLTSFLQKHP